MLPRSSNSENAPFLDYSSMAKEEGPQNDPLSTKRRSGWLLCSARLFHLVMITANAIFFAANVVNFSMATQNPSGEQDMLSKPRYAEPQEAPIEVNTIRWGLPIGKRSNFTSFDSEVADAAWTTRGISHHQGWLKMPTRELASIGETSVEFKDGLGHLVGMDVFHQLHCLNYLRKKIDPYKKSYPEIAEDAQIPPLYHIAHCIDSIRLSLECHSDLSIIPQRWVDGWLEPWPVWQNQHVCRNFSRIREWAHLQQPNVAGQIIHPGMGVVSSGHANNSAVPIYREEHDDILSVVKLNMAT